MKKHFSEQCRNTISVSHARTALGVIGSLALAAFTVSAPAQQRQNTQQTQPTRQAQPTQLASNDNSPANPASASPLPVAANSSGPVLNSSLNSLDGAEPAVGATPVIETSGPMHTCDDGISASLQQDVPNMPCWANIRTVDHWNSMFIPEGVAFHESDESQIPSDVPSSFGYTAGGMSAYEFPDSPQIKVYGGLIAGAGLIEKHTWQMMVEDAAGLGDAQYQGASFAGINRFAARGTGEITPRWTWQANATDTYGTDALRTFAPLDYRMIGESEAPAPDTVAYGLHSGNVLNQEEGMKLRFAGDERSHWDFSAGDDYRKYTDDGFSVQTIRGRAEYLHALTRNTAVGVFGEGDHQTNLLDCSLGGGGGRLVTEWNNHASLNVSGGVYGAGASCGKSIQFQGEAALYMPVADKTDVYVSANRGLGDGAVERAVFLDSASVGLRHTFQRQLSARLSGTALYGTDPANNTSLHGSFSEASIRYPLPMGFSQETAIRHYSVSGFAAPPNRTLAVITFWWSPQKHRSASN